jgi:hypothetical protein
MSSGAVVDHRGRPTKFLRDIKKQYFSLMFGVVMYLVTASLLEMGRRLLLGTGRWRLLLSKALQWPLKYSRLED